MLTASPPPATSNLYFPGNDRDFITFVLGRIRWLAAAQDGTMDTANAALLQIDDLAAEVIALYSSSPSQR